MHKQAQTKKINITNKMFLAIVYWPKEIKEWSLSWIQISAVVVQESASSILKVSVGAVRYGMVKKCAIHPSNHWSAQHLIQTKIQKLHLNLRLLHQTRFGRCWFFLLEPARSCLIIVQGLNFTGIQAIAQLGWGACAMSTELICSYSFDTWMTLYLFLDTAFLIALLKVCDARRLAIWQTWKHQEKRWSKTNHFFHSDTTNR